MPKLTLFSEQDEYSTKVLVVEDDEADFELMFRSFQDSDFENELVWIPSGQQLIDYLLCQGEYTDTGHANPILIFLDINMPGYDGKETLQKLGEHRDISDLRIVMLTNADKDHVDSLSLSKMPYIQKPLDYDKMYGYIMNNKHFLFQ